ncbi:cupin domain-containing protein [Candidatus Bathyarchaeota archaeon]|nr:MAG: cupin domain-containing protein [Candidatus Bathyarchaeota archaeon]
MSHQEALRMKDEVAPKVERLVDLVSYQKGAVVSRTMLDKDAGTVTLFAFDAGEGLSEHTTPYDAMVTILDGKAEIKIGGEPFLLGEGETIVMPADVPHALRAVERFKMLLVMVKA